MGCFYCIFKTLRPSTKEKPHDFRVPVSYFIKRNQDISQEILTLRENTRFLCPPLESHLLGSAFKHRNNPELYKAITERIKKLEVERDGLKV